MRDTLSCGDIQMAHASQDDTAAIAAIGNEHETVGGEGACKHDRTTAGGSDARAGGGTVAYADGGAGRRGGPEGFYNMARDRGPAGVGGEVGGDQSQAG